MLFKQIENVRELRKKLRLNQTEFWTNIGVTQSGGSRYESGRSMPKPLRELVRLAYIEKINLAALNQLDLTIASLLKEQQPELYKTLKKEIKNRNEK